MRIKQMIIQCNLSKMKHKILPTCSQGNFRDSIGGFSNTSNGMSGAERVKTFDKTLKPHFLKFAKYITCNNVTIQIYKNILKPE